MGETEVSTGTTDSAVGSRASTLAADSASEPSGGGAVHPNDDMIMHVAATTAIIAVNLRIRCMKIPTGLGAGKQSLGADRG